MTKDERIKKLESYLERYTAIADRMYSTYNGWVMDDANFDNLIKLEDDIKRELGK